MGEQRPRCATAYMDLELLNPFAADYPEHVESSHEFGDAKAVCARFNGGGIFAGQYIAVGREQGRVSIFDFETKESIRFLHGHTRTVSTVCWSQSSRYLLTAAADWLVNVWDLSVRPSDLLSDSRKRCIRFDAEVTSAQLHPRNSKLFVATLNQQREPELVDFRLKDAREEQYRFQLEMPSGFDEQGEPVYGRSADRMSDDEDDEDESREMATICRFNPTGDLIFAGTSEGNIVVWDTVTREPLSYQQVCAPSEILSIEFDPSGTSIVVNAKDRCLRVLRLSEGGDDDNEQSDAVLSSPSRPRRRRIEDPRKLRMDEEHRFQDLVNRTPWKGANFSRDGEYIVGGADNNGSHNIYIWDRTAGSLIKILEGPKDPLSDLHWHPTRPVIASVSQLGALYIWVTSSTENWGAYAPGFEELEENREYPEKEDEFDVEDESKARQREEEMQDKNVDITTIELGRLEATAPPESPSKSSNKRRRLDWEQNATDRDRAYEAFIARDLEENDTDNKFYIAVDVAGAVRGFLDE